MKEGVSDTVAYSIVKIEADVYKTKRRRKRREGNSHLCSVEKERTAAGGEEFIRPLR